jgi:D-3-phosphoglycerate dehydrogenase/glyoxylate/hydroxypyruvate reductase A
VSILVLNTSPFVEQQRAALAELAPDEQIHTDPIAAPPADVEALLAFKLAPGIAPRFPALKFVACAGAGVDQLLANCDVPAQLPVVRAFDPMQGHRMAQYVTLMVLRFHRELPRLEALHAEGQWHRFLPIDERKHAVGIMGYGSIGAPIAQVLMQLGFPVRVWTRRPRSIDGVKAFAGRDGFVPFLAQSAILVCALPLTPETAGLLGAPEFSALPRGAFVINVSRGAIVREGELLAAVDSGHLAGAALDVFEIEPLPTASPLWRHRKILCTPHIAAMPRPDVAAKQFLENLRRARAGLELLNVVDRNRGY